AAEIMSVANVGFLPVLDGDRRVVGTITDRDIVVRGGALGRAQADRSVADVMSHNVVACRPEDEMAIVEQFMAYYQVSRLVITNERDELVGVISLSDIAEREPAKRAARTLRAVAAREAPRSTHGRRRLRVSELWPKVNIRSTRFSLFWSSDVRTWGRDTGRGQRMLRRDRQRGLARCAC